VRDAREPLPQGLGQLFGDGAAGRVLDVDLPPGRLVVPCEEPADTRPAYWLSDEPGGGELWARLQKAHAQSGLWPVLVSDFEPNTKVPWVAGEVSPQPVADIDGLHAGEVLAGFWDEWADDGSDLRELEPFGRDWPGLAQATVAGPQPDEFAAQFVREHEDGTSRIMLVPAARSADVITAVGWQGPLNFSEDMAPLSAVLRSWEDRFGARLVELGFDTLALTVAAPPLTTEHAEHVAAEHLAFCPDNIVQGMALTIRAYAASAVREKTVWPFWWD
jgi:Domain of unknown function (DUF4253)